MKVNDKDKKSFILYKDFLPMFTMLSMEDRGRLISAIFNYVSAGEAGIELSDSASMAFVCIRTTLDRDLAAYEAKCAQNAANGQKGGRPRKGTKSESTAPESGNFFEAKTERFFSKPKKADNDNDNDSGTESENENEIDNDTDSGTDSGTDNERGVSDSALSEIRSADAPLKSEGFKQEGDPQGVGEAMSDLQKEVEFPGGVPKAYIADRLDRLNAYVARSGREKSKVIAEWWAKESRATRLKYGVGTSPKKEPPPPESFDVDDFFAAALMKSRLGTGG